MLEDSQEPIVNKDSENVAVSETSPSEACEKLKSNYCYVCHVPCTSKKNLYDHMKGRKHLQKLNKSSPVNIKKNKKTSDHTTKSSNFLLSNEAPKKTDKYSEVTVNDNQNSFTSCGDSAKEAMSNSDRYTPKRNRFQYSNTGHDSSYSRYHNAKYSYSNKNQEYYNNPNSQYRFHWNSPYLADDNYQNHGIARHHYANSGYNQSLHGDANSGYYQQNNDYFSENRHAVFKSSNNSEGNPFLSDDIPDNLYLNSSHSRFNRFIDNSESRGSKKVAPVKTDNPKRKGCSQVNISCSSKNTENARQNAKASSSSSLSPSIVATSSKANESCANTSQASSSESNVLKSRLSNRIRSRSLSSSGSSSGKKNKNKAETQYVDEDSVAEEQKIKEWTDTLLDSNHNKITRLLHPSNYKEKAVVNQLITEFSKFKRKEIARNLRSNSLTGDETDYEKGDASNETEGVITGKSDFNSENDLNEKIGELCESNSENEITIVLDSKMPSGEINLSDHCAPGKKRNTRASRRVISGEKSNTQNSSDVMTAVSSQKNQNFKKSSKRDGKSKELGMSVSSKKVKILHFNSEKSGKRKNSINDNNNKEKKQRTYGSTCSENPESSNKTDLQNLKSQVPAAENSTAASDLLKPSDPASTLSALFGVKEEMPEYSGTTTTVATLTANSQSAPDPELRTFSVPMNPNISVDSLIQLFASGNVKVKEEFNDPVMDAIKGISSDELMNACSEQTFLDKVNETLPDSKHSKDKFASKAPVVENFDLISPVTADSSVESNVNLTSFSKDIQLSNITQDQNLPPSNNEVDKSSSNSFSEMQNLLDKTNSASSPHLKKLVEKLQEISSEEETVKTKLSEAKSKISEFSSLLEEWKKKKKKLQDKEEYLRKNRNEVIKSLQSAFSDDTESETLPSLEHAKKTELPTFGKMGKTCGKTVAADNRHKSQKKNKTLLSSETDEVTILPSPVKPSPPEIVLDDDVENASQSQSNSRCEIGTSIISCNESKFSNVRNICAHSTVVNCLVVFEDFVYTCSNDTTGKRFGLKDSNLTVIYRHSAKNVTEIVVEKVQNEALVFTCCSTKVISLFIASSGTKLRTFFPPCSVMSICKGWGKFYAGLENGCVNVYNWKYEEREVVKTEFPASRIDTAHQGRLHVLVILSTDGKIAVRDAETGLLIHYLKTDVKLPSWMIVYNDLAYLSSSDKTLIILDIMSGRELKKLCLNSFTTGLAVYEDYIFAISYNGLINCFNKNISFDKRLYFGAGKNGLTCLHVYQDLVFTGNRKGNISLFQFDPQFSVTCEFGKCDVIYGFKEDLEYHVEKNHIVKNKSVLKCAWRGCNYTFPIQWNQHEKMNHLKIHIYKGCFTTV